MYPLTNKIYNTLVFNFGSGSRIHPQLPMKTLFIYCFLRGYFSNNISCLFVYNVYVCGFAGCFFVCGGVVFIIITIYLFIFIKTDPNTNCLL